MLKGDRHRQARSTNANYFKLVNAIHGHAAGNAILGRVTRRLRVVLREADMVARLGGDEFAAILVGTLDKHVKAMAESLIKAASVPYEYESNVIRISASSDVANYPESSIMDREALRMADVAICEAKYIGKVHVICAGAKMVDGVWNHFSEPVQN